MASTNDQVVANDQRDALRQVVSEPRIDLDVLLWKEQDALSRRPALVMNQRQADERLHVYRRSGWHMKAHVAANEAIASFLIESHVVSRRLTCGHHSRARDLPFDAQEWRGKGTGANGPAGGRPTRRRHVGLPTLSDGAVLMREGQTALHVKRAGFFLRVRALTDAHNECDQDA